MRALGVCVVDFPNYPVRLLAWAIEYLPAQVLRPLLRRLVASGRGGKKPSLQMDLAGGRQRSEVRFLNGAVSVRAEQLGLPAPVNRVLLDTLMGIAAGRTPWEEFRHRPERLLAAIRSA
jgi:2-dehydropantoate 2-reductase